MTLDPSTKFQLSLYGLIGACLFLVSSVAVSVYQEISVPPPTTVVLGEQVVGEPLEDVVLEEVPDVEEISARSQATRYQIDTTRIESLINRERVQRGYEPLVLARELRQSACMKRDHMIENDYWAHISPSGVTPWSFFEKAHADYRSKAENLARGHISERAVVQGWMDSPGHRQAILGDYTHHGICVYQGVVRSNSDINIFVHHFGR